MGEASSSMPILWVALGGAVTIIAIAVVVIAVMGSNKDE